MFTLKIETGNVATETHEQVADLLHDLWDAVLAGGDEGVILDHNGNTVGSWNFE